MGLANRRFAGILSGRRVVVVKKDLLDKMSIYIPQEKQDRSINYLVLEAILQYLDREEKL